MTISAKDVKALRDRTGTGMMDCKKALQETNGDLEAAIDLLRSTGAAKAAKRSAKSARAACHERHKNNCKSFDRHSVYFP